MFLSPRFEKSVLQRLTVQLMVTPRFSLRVIEQYDSFEETLESSGLASYEVNYGTAAHLGYAETRTPGEPDVRAIFAKVGYLWRP